MSDPTDHDLHATGDEWFELLASLEDDALPAYGETGDVYLDEEIIP